MMLQAAIDQATKALLKKPLKGISDTAAEDGLIFVGNWHGTYPSALVIDPNLEAIDVRVYLFICQHSKDFTLGAAPFPSYELICNRLQISKPTLANSMTRLRLTRWVSLVKHGIRDEQGRFKGQVLALSDEPIALVDALEMDSSYSDLVERTALEHSNKKTRQVAQGVLLGIDEQCKQGIDPLARKNPMLERHQSVLSLDTVDGMFFGIVNVAAREKQEKQKRRQQQAEENSLLGVLGDFELSTGKPPKQPSKDSLPRDFSPSQNSLPGEKPSKDSLPRAQVIDFKGNENSLPGAPYCTSTSISISTVPNDLIEKPKTDFVNGLASELISNHQNNNNGLNWHEQLIIVSDDERNILARMLNAQSPENAQMVLDALAYRFQSVIERGAEPLRRPVVYARSLFKSLANGSFVAVSPETEVMTPKASRPARAANYPQQSNGSARFAHPSHKPFKAPEPEQNALPPELSKLKIQEMLAGLNKRLPRHQ